MKNILSVKSLLMIFFFTLLLSSCKKDIVEDKNEVDSPVLIQVSVIDALLQGIYDGILPIDELKALGDIGIGTFDKLNGELIMYNDTIYQALYSGEVIIPSSDNTTPFATVCKWETNATFSLVNFNFDSLRTNFDEFFPTPNIFYGIKINGSFEYMKTRIVEPNKPLGEAAENQAEFEYNNIDGVIIGFFCPDYVNGINAKGFHLHFLSTDRKRGGHILSFTMDKANMEICYLFEFQMILPEEGSFFNGDFSVDREEELEDAEGDN